MKIVYSCGPRHGAGLQVARFLEYISSSPIFKNWEVRIAGHYSYSNSLNLNWNLSSLSSKDLEFLIADLADFKPDLVICDLEPIISKIAHQYNFNLWYVSPVHILNGSFFPWKKTYHYTKFINAIKYINYLPKPHRYYICSPFNFLKLKPGFKQIFPYYKENDPAINNHNLLAVSDQKRFQDIKNITSKVIATNNYCYDTEYHNTFNYNSALNGKYFVSSGESGAIMDALYHKMIPLIMPETLDLEALINASICQVYNLGLNCGQLELAQQHSVNIFEKKIKATSYDQINFNSKLELLDGEIFKYGLCSF
jgi:hypothetical protein